MQAGDNRTIVLQLTDIVPLVRKYFSNANNKIL